MTYDLDCKNCAHFRPAHDYVPHECALANLPAPIESDFCDEFQTTHEANADRALAVMRGAVLKARGSSK